MGKGSPVVLGEIHWVSQLLHKTPSTGFSELKLNTLITINTNLARCMCEK